MTSCAPSCPCRSVLDTVGGCCSLADSTDVPCAYHVAALRPKPVKKERSRAELNAEDRAKWDAMVREVQQQEAARFASRQPLSRETQSCDAKLEPGAGDTSASTPPGTAAPTATAALSGATATMQGSTAPTPKARRPKKPRSPKQLAADQAFKERKAMERKAVAQQEAIWANAGTDFEAAPSALVDEPDSLEF